MYVTEWDFLFTLCVSIRTIEWSADPCGRKLRQRQPEVESLEEVLIQEVWVPIYHPVIGRTDQSILVQVKIFNFIWGEWFTSFATMSS